MNAVQNFDMNINPQPQSLEALIQELPLDLRTEVRHFVEFLLTKRQPAPEQKLHQNWAGALRKYRQEYSSLELQHQALNWRGD